MLHISRPRATPALFIFDSIAGTVSGRVKKIANKSWISIAALLLAAVIAVLFFSESLNPWVRGNRRNGCLNNLKIIHSVVISVALESRYYRGDAIPTNRLAGYLKDNRIPVCPSGGRYTIPLVGGHSVCSHHGDIFDQEGLLKGPPSFKESAIRERPSKQALTTEKQ